MTIEFQIQQAQFRTGVQEGEDSRALKFGMLTKVENLVWRKGGKLERRRGCTLAKSFSPNGYMLNLGDKIAYCIGDAVVDADGGTIPGYLPHVDIAKGAEVRPAKGCYSAITAENPGSSSIVVWSNGDPIVGTVGTNLYAQIAWPSGRQASVVTIALGSYIPIDVFFDSGDYCVISQEDTAIGTLRLHRIQAVLNTVSSTVTLVAGVNGYSGARKCGSKIVACYTLNATGFATYGIWDLVGTPIANNNILAGDITAGCHCVGYDDTYSPTTALLGWIHNGGDFKAITLTIATPSLGAVRVVQATIDVTEPLSQCAITVTASGGMAAVDVKSLTNGLITVPIDSTCLPDATRKHVTFGVEMISAPVTIGPDVYIVASDNRYWGDGIRNSNTYLLRIPPTTSALTPVVNAQYTAYPYKMIAGNPHDYAAKLAHVEGSCFGIGTVPRAIVKSSTKASFITPFLVEPNNNQSSLVGYRGWDVSQSDWTRSQGQIVNVGGDTIIRVGVLSVCDGSNVFDYGFGASPTMTNKSVAGGAVAAGTYLCAASYEWSSRNLKYRSDLTNIFSATTAAANLTIVNSVMRLGPSNKQPASGVGYGDAADPKLTLKSYRSVAGQPVLFKLTLEPSYNMVVSTQCQSADIYSDTRSDTSISGTGRPIALSSRPNAYTEGGVLGDIQPPYFSLLINAIGRLWGVQPGGREVWFSKAFDDDFSFAPGFVTAFRLQFEFSPTGLAELDNRIVIFGSNAIAVVSGNGPGVSAQGNDFDPQYIQSDAGCTDSESVVSMPDGIMYRSVGGLMILTRGLTVERIGRDVQDLTDTYTRHLCSTLVTKDREVRFVLVKADLSDGIVLVYNYEEKQWSVHRYPFIVKQIVTIGNDVYVMSKDGNVYKESDTNGLDDGAWSSPLFDTAWISSNGSLLFQAIRRFALLGESLSPHHLHVDVYFDYESEAYRTFDVNSTELLTSIRELNDMQVTIGKRRKCNAIRFRIRIDQPDDANYGTAKGVSFSAMAIEFGIKKGLRARPKGIKR